MDKDEEQNLINKVITLIDKENLNKLQARLLEPIHIRRYSLRSFIINHFQFMKYILCAHYFRFLIATKWDPKQAANRITEAIKYRDENSIDFQTIEPLIHHVVSGKNYHNGFDKQGRPIQLMRV